MKFLYAQILLIGFAAIGFSCYTQGPITLPTATASAVPGTVRSVAETPAQTRIASAKLQLQTNPKKVQAYNDLALAYLERARETEDPKFLQEASQALTKGLALDPNDFPAAEDERSSPFG